MQRTIASLRHFLERNGLPTKGVTISLEFEDYMAARRAKDAVEREFLPMMRYEANPPKLEPLRIMDIPVKITAKL